MKRRNYREVSEEVSKEFLINLMKPFQPTIMKDEKITDLSIETGLDNFDFTYVIVRNSERIDALKGGVENS